MVCAVALAPQEDTGEAALRVGSSTGISQMSPATVLGPAEINELLYMTLQLGKEKKRKEKKRKEKKRKEKKRKEKKRKTRRKINLKQSFAMENVYTNR
ncbi:hypothetical protein llap_14624 [Limosa lapponica baueri]|uniref:Uncharacterized protein n=1 Tax=Limosa lapponica baueri TaxID=1758121 RepID=A0A2I0TMN2_LIMLA|nr:hypothetical protein llap_14624 [Limosa lapponica baueri]